jgi:AcrR family transcriptional regulator
MDDLAGELGMSKKTLYAHFSSKTELVEAVLRTKFGDLEHELDRITSEKTLPFLDALHRMLAVVQWHADEVRPSFVRDLRRAEPELFGVVETRRTAVIREQFGRLFAAGRRAGMVRKDVPVQLAIAVLLGATQSIMNPERIAELAITPRAGISAILTVVLEGILTKSGRPKR